MARYWVRDEEGSGEAGENRAPLEGLAVAKAMAQQRSRDLRRTFLVVDADTSEELARYAPPPEDSTGELANSVKRMRAANDRLKQGLTPASPPVAREKKGA
jgi:hypothetical protein